MKLTENLGRRVTPGGRVINIANASAALVLSLLIAGGCDRPEGAGSSRLSPAASTDMQRSGAHGARTEDERLEPLVRCEQPAAGEQELSSFESIVDGRRYFVDVAFDGGNSEWLPIKRIDMPPHHSSRIEWVNVEDFPAIAMFRRDRLRFTFNLNSRYVEKVPEQDRWSARYAARIVMVCKASQQ